LHHLYLSLAIVQYQSVMGILGRCRLSRVYARAIASKPVSIQFTASKIRNQVIILS
jgi:hypothetical protein